jgi:hypothetical protein
MYEISLQETEWFTLYDLAANRKNAILMIYALVIWICHLKQYHQTQMFTVPVLMYTQRAVLTGVVLSHFTYAISFKQTFTGQEI